MEDRWFVYAEGIVSIETVRSMIAMEGGNQCANMEELRNSNRREEHLRVFEIPFSAARNLRKSEKDGGDPLTFRFFRKTFRSEYPFEDDPLSNKSPKVEAQKRAIKARIKREGARN